ncbi:MAG TPA: hypothetical protein VF384_05475 [Planctomycetota bacterium]
MGPSGIAAEWQHAKLQAPASLPTTLVGSPNRDRRRGARQLHFGPAQLLPGNARVEIGVTVFRDEPSRGTRLRTTPPRAR